jgi:hypothetical protein
MALLAAAISITFEQHKDMTYHTQNYFFWA